jgi:uncharacterized OB-fold protein
MPQTTRLPERSEGPWVTNLDPLMFQWNFGVTHNVSYAQDTPFFAGLAKGKLLGSRCTKCDRKFATPRACCMECGGKTEWFELPLRGRIHSWTICYFSGEPYLKECPFMLGLIEFDGVDTLFMTRLAGIEKDDARIGLPVRAKFRRKKTWSVNDVYFVADTDGNGGANNSNTNKATKAATSSGSAGRRRG